MLAVAYQNFYQFAVMLFLMACSAFFSGSETAFFNLSRRQVRQLKDSPNRIYHISARLLKKPDQLLNCLLFGNMIINVLYFATSHVLSIRLSKQYGLTVAAITAFASFLLLVLFGEILPKSLAYASSLFFTKISTLPAYICFKGFVPFQIFFKLFVLEPVLRLFLGPQRSQGSIGANELRSLIGATRKQGLISADEKKLMLEVVDLGLLKVRHVVRPRVDLIAVDINEGYKKVLDVMLENHLTKMPIFSKSIDNIIGVVHLRHLLLEPEAPLEQFVRQVHFVPEQKTVVSLLELFRQMEADIAIVVDEYGGIVGTVQLEDIAEELLGPVRKSNEAESIEQTGPFEYRLPGGLAVHDWAEAFGVDLEDMRASTLGGFVTELLGKVPVKGDVAYLQNLKFTVDKVKRHRIESLIINIRPSNIDEQ